MLEKGIFQCSRGCGSEKLFLRAGPKTPILLPLLFHNNPILCTTTMGLRVSNFIGARSFTQIGEFIFTMNRALILTFMLGHCGQLYISTTWYQSLRFFIVGKEEGLPYIYYSCNGILSNLLANYGCKFHRAMSSVAGQKPLTHPS